MKIHYLKKCRNDVTAYTALTVIRQLIDIHKVNNTKPNRISNKLLNCDWSSARLFLTRFVRGHVGVELQPSN